MPLIIYPACFIFAPLLSDSRIISETEAVVQGLEAIGKAAASSSLVQAIG